MSLFTKHNYTHTHMENKLMAAKGERGRGKNWKFGLNIYMRTF